MRARHLSIIIFTTFLSGCATAYQKEGFFNGGYSEIVAGPDSFIVTFRGNSSTSRERVSKLSLLRASELTLQNGYKYFVILSSSDASSRTSVSTPLYGTYYTSTYEQPGSSIRIKCFKKDPNLTEAIDANYYWAANHE